MSWSREDSGLVAVDEFCGCGTGRKGIECWLGYSILLPAEEHVTKKYLRTCWLNVRTDILLSWIRLYDLKTQLQRDSSYLIGLSSTPPRVMNQEMKARGKCFMTKNSRSLRSDKNCIYKLKNCLKTSLQWVENAEKINEVQDRLPRTAIFA